MAWKNGGGVTHEVMTYPDGAGLDDFHWRVSVAEVNAPGAFSLFPDCDRILSILEGGPMRLSTGSHVVALKIDTEPFAFPADQPASAEALEAPVVDLNVMTRRDRAHASIAVHRAGPLALPRMQATRLIVVSGGEAIGGGTTLANRDVLIVDDEIVQIDPADQTRLYLITIPN